LSSLLVRLQSIHYQTSELSFSKKLIMNFKTLSTEVALNAKKETNRTEILLRRNILFPDENKIKASRADNANQKDISIEIG
jgi:hypothetical protein